MNEACLIDVSPLDPSITFTPESRPYVLCHSYQRLQNDDIIQKEGREASVSR